TNNPATREAWLNARTAEANLGSRRSAYYPEVDVNANLGRSIVGASAGRSAAASSTFSPSVALSYLLFDFGGRAATVEEARQTLIAADFEHNQTIQNVVLAAEQNYFQALDAKALLDAQAATVKERQAELNTAEGRHSGGLATIADVLQARTERARRHELGLRRPRAALPALHRLPQRLRRARGAVAGGAGAGGRARPDAADRAAGLVELLRRADGQAAHRHEPRPARERAGVGERRRRALPRGRRHDPRRPHRAIRAGDRART